MNHRGLQRTLFRMQCDPAFAAAVLAVLFGTDFIRTVEGTVAGWLGISLPLGSSTCAADAAGAAET